MSRFRKFSANPVVQIPASAYEAELKRGSIALRFPKALEAEFRRANLGYANVRARIWQSALLLAFALAAGYRLVGPGRGSWTVDVFLELVVLPPALLAMFFAAVIPALRHRYLQVSFPAGVVVAVALSVLVARAIGEGSTSALVFLTTYSLGVFSLMGLLFYEALWVGAACVLAFGLAGVAQGLPAERLAFDLALLAGITVMAASISQGVERYNRRYFLERAVLGELADRDGLTTLHNRRAFDEHLIRVWQQGLRDRSPVAILLIDLDHFKNYNDRHGHQSGDACLRHVAQIVQGFARRPLDLAARYGGEELAIVLYQVTPEHAASLAEQLRSAVESTCVRHRDSASTGRVTVSVGVAWIGTTIDCSPDDSVELADRALYAAKQAGRNCIEVASRAPAAPAAASVRLAVAS